MAQRRMFSPDIVCSDAFLDMPSTGRDLYYQLGMYADDDGFVNPRKIMRMLGSSEDDLKILIAKRFVLPFPSGVLVIKHWKINNLVRKDWYRPTQYIEERKALQIKENGAYTEIKPLLVNEFVNDSSTQVRLGKDRLISASATEAGTPPDSAFKENLTEETPKKGQRNPIAIKLAKWYGDKARETNDSKSPYEASGFYQVNQAIKKYGEIEVKKMLEYYLDSEKFHKYPMLTSALSADSISKYLDQSKGESLLYDR